MADPIALTFQARDLAHARRIIEAVEGVEAGPASDEILVTRDGPPPTGHTYRELCEARRRGALDAHMTPRGLVTTAAALEAYRAGRRRRRDAGGEVVDLNAHVARAFRRKR